VGSDREAPLRVCLVGLAAGHGSGVSRYAATLARALDGVSPEFPGLSLGLLTTRAGSEAIAARRIDVRDLGLRWRAADAGPVRVPLEQVLVATRPADLLHFFDLTGPLLRPRRPFVTTIHDAGVLHGFRKVRHAYKRRLQPWALRHAAAVVAVSEFTKGEAVQRFGAAADRISVIHSGPGLTGTPAADSVGRDGGYFLYVGDLTVKKNVGFLVRAFSRTDAPNRLVLAGRMLDDAERLTEEIGSSPKRDRIELVGSPSDEELDALYRSATALVHPSRYEGFGFTPLEAMARGCPVLASDVPAIREVSGAGAQLLPLDDEAAWTEALSRVAKDTSFRSDLRASGARAVEAYSWEETARRLCRLFLSIPAASR
jgi:glycosyltransferase involved in cell wall biosynthesis